MSESIKQLLLDDLRGSVKPKPQLVQLAYSAGKASEALLWMVLRGEIEVPAQHFIVTCADPGMEHPLSYVHAHAMEKRCRERGIPFLTAHVDLYQGILNAKKSGATRFDFPGFYTKNRETGSIGKMMQRCTKWCKIAPMDRLARHWMDANMGISKKTKRVGHKILQKWIGFTYDEADRIKPHRVPKYVCFDYPLVNLRLTVEDLLVWYGKNGLTVPPRSVCNACFANDSVYFKSLYQTQPEAWARAVAIDDEIRDLSQFGMRDECFVYSGCISLRELAKQGFPASDVDQDSKCHSGHCFI